ncbi:MAG: PDZ domain-containing protein [Myxococcales bacterium]|jgi:S1-C subfamily serine protease|nr:PDZ domain-containing protein [Myxococcales bacterium]
MGEQQKIADAYEGILVLGALPGSPAAELGLRYGDVLLAVNGMRTRVVEDFLVARTLNTQRMRLQIVRGGQAVSVELDISERTTRKSLQQVTDHLLGANAAPSSEPGSKSS